MLNRANLKAAATMAVAGHQFSAKHGAKVDACRTA